MGGTSRWRPPKIWLHMPAKEGLGKGRVAVIAKLPANFTKSRRDQCFIVQCPFNKKVSIEEKALRLGKVDSVNIG